MKNENTSLLENMLVRDQQAIKDFREKKISTSELQEINRKHVACLKEIIEKNGFPTITTTSHEAYKSAVVVVLHSEDIELLKQSIQFLKNRDVKDIEKAHIAFMVDKMRVLQNLPQLYGTQYRVNQDNVPEYIPIENPEALEERRKELGMEPSR